MEVSTGTEAGAWIEQCVCEFLERLERDGREAADERLRELYALRPEHADVLCERLERLDRIGLLSSSPSDADGFPERLGDFRLIRRLGMGGMGVVYLAEQTSLSRRVALKLIRPEHLFFESARARFRREVESVARLTHPNIVPIHTVGEDNGVPYFAMEYVDGVGLDTLLETVPRSPERLSGADLRGVLARGLHDEHEETLPVEREWNDVFFQGSWPDVCLRILRQVTQALAHAHERGVLHRDVKPSNVMLTPSGRALLLDFGLASTQGGESLTRSGSRLGSLPYMPPEQIDRGSFTAASDVYGVGVLMYELLTLRPPYRGDTVQETQRAILDGSVLRPRALHTSLPVDVETVCLKAMSVDVGRRYPDASAVGSDLDNLIEHRPIAARPAGPLLRLRRWSQRNPVAALLVAVVILGPSLFAAERVRAAARIQSSFEREKEARERAEAHFTELLRSLDFVLRKTAENELADTPQAQLTRLVIVDRALSVLDAIAPERPADDLRVPTQRAILLSGRARILYDLERFDEAIDASVESLAVLETLVEDPEADIVVRAEYARGLALHARTISEAGEYSASIPVFRRAVERLRDLADESPPEDLSRRRSNLASTSSNLGRAYLRSGDPDEAAVVLEESLELTRSLTEDHPHVASYAFERSRALAVAADLAAVQHDREDRVAYLEEALEEKDRGLELEPNDRHERSGRALISCSLGYAYFDLGDHDAARSMFEDARRRVERLEQEFPALPNLPSLRLETTTGLAQVHRATGRPELARDLLEEVAALRAEAADAEPERADLAEAAAVAFSNASNMVMMSPDLDDGRFDRALEHAEKGLVYLRKSGPTAMEESPFRAFLLYQRVNCLSMSDRLDDARPALDDLDGCGATDPMSLRYCADAWNEWSLALSRAEEREGVDLEQERAEADAKVFEHLNAAVDAGYRDATELQSTPSLAAYRDRPAFRALLEKLGSQ